VHPGVSARWPARFPGDEAAGKAGALMAGRAVRETVTLAGRAERARLARAFVEGVLVLRQRLVTFGSGPATMRSGRAVAAVVDCE
jgi:hypothetical protein